MGLFKDIEWVDGDQNHLRIGPGNVFDELQAFAITRNRYIASGWVKFCVFHFYILFSIYFRFIFDLFLFSFGFFFYFFFWVFFSNFSSNISTVGIVGWSIGGGHGPFAPSAGLGVDNVVEVSFLSSLSQISLTHH